MEALYRRILVAMDLTEMDENLLSLVALLNGLVPADKIYLVHIIPDLNAPENEDLMFHKMFTSSYPVDEKVKDVLNERASDFFDKRSTKLEVDVLEGKPYQELLHWIDVKEVDLVVFGHKEIQNGSGITPKRMARKSKSNILFVPNKRMEKINEIIVPIDFSDCSGRALSHAIALKNRIGSKASVRLLHVVKMIATDYYYGLNLNEKYHKQLKAQAEKRCLDFLKILDLDPADFEISLEVESQRNIAIQIDEFVKQHNSDLVLMGAKGHSPFNNFLFGSVTEQFVNICSAAPVLVIR